MPHDCPDCVALRAAVLALADEWEQNGGWDLDYAARLRAVITDTTGGGNDRG